MREYCEANPDNQEALYILSTLIRDEYPSLYKKLNRTLLIKADRYYDEALQVVSPLELTQKEFLRLLYGLHRSLRYKDAERLATQRLKENPDDKRLKIALADTLYRLRRYKEAAMLYEETKRYLHAARSYFRADDEVGLMRIVTLTEKMKGPTPCSALILMGKQYRSHGKTDKALRFLRKAYRNYQSCKEEALWEIAWTEYLNRQYLNAAYNLRDLYNKYKNPKYLYWLKRANSYLNLSELSIKTPLDRESFYYSLLNYKRTIKNILLNQGNNSFFFRLSFKNNDLTSVYLNRINALKEAGLRNYIRREILFQIERNEKDRKALIKELFNSGFYRDGILLAKRFSIEDRRLLYPVTYPELIGQICKELHLDPLLLLSLMRVESRFDPMALSRSGAKGLMQLMDFTARRWAERNGIKVSFEEDDENSVFNPEINVRLGATYLKWLLERFKNPFLAVAAYNGGENAVDRWLKELKYNGIDEFLEMIPYEETRLYVKKVFSTYEKYRSIYLRPTLS